MPVSHRNPKRGLVKVRVSEPTERRYYDLYAEWRVGRDSFDQEMFLLDALNALAAHRANALVARGLSS